MYDPSVPSSLDRLGGWIDEFLQTAYSGPSPPAVIVVRSVRPKHHRQAVDHDSERGEIASARDELLPASDHAISVAAAEEWCAGCQWPSEVWRTSASVAVPHFILEWTDEASLSVVSENLRQLCAERVRVCRLLAPTGLPAWHEAEYPTQHADTTDFADTVDTMNPSDVSYRASLSWNPADHAIAMKSLLYGTTLAVRAPSMVPPSHGIHFSCPDHIDCCGSDEVAFPQCVVPTSNGNVNIKAAEISHLHKTTPGAQLAVLLIGLGFQAWTVVESIRKWFAAAQAASLCFQPQESVTFVVFGLKNIGSMSSLDECEDAVAKLCTELGIVFCAEHGEPSAEFVTRSWQRLTTILKTQRRNIITARLQQAVECATARCPNRHKGCQWYGRPLDQRAHTTRCLFTSLRCRFDPCPVEVMRKDRIEHEKVCAHRNGNCKVCGQGFVGDVVAHMQVCRTSKAACPPNETQRDEAPNQENVLNPNKGVFMNPFADFPCAQTSFHSRDELDEHLQSRAGAYLATAGWALSAHKRAMEKQQQIFESRLATVMEHWQGEAQALRGQLIESEQREAALRAELKDLRLEMKAIWGTLEVNGLI